MQKVRGITNWRLISLLPRKYLTVQINNRHTRKRCKMCSKVSKTPAERLDHVHCRSTSLCLYRYSSVSIADLKQVNVFWANTDLGTVSKASVI